MAEENGEEIQEQSLKYITQKYFPGIYTHWTETRVQTSKQETINLDGVHEEIEERLRDEYKRLGPAHSDEFVIPVLENLCENIRLDQSATAPCTFDDLICYFARQDMLKLYIACSDRCNFSGRMTLKCQNRSVTIDNTCDWVQDLMIRLFLKKHLPDITSKAEAVEMLNLSYSSKAGRKYHDTRVPIIMKGLHKMLSDTHDFSTKIPNSLCSFIIFYLGLCRIAPQENEADIPWVRAQLSWLLRKNPSPAL